MPQKLDCDGLKTGRIISRPEPSGDQVNVGESKLTNLFSFQAIRVARIARFSVHIVAVRQ